jgi:hypothetical protein
LARHLSCVLPSLLLFVSIVSARHQSGTPEVTLLPEDISDVIASYFTPDPARSVRLLKEEMPAPVTDAKFRAAVMEQLPPRLMRFHIQNSELTGRVREVLEPVLALYGRLHVYEIVVIRHPTPLLMSDSGVVLIITTGMMEQAASDDELLGYVAHEVGHEYFIRKSVAAKQLLRVIIGAQNERAITRKTREVLATIEVECDAFASLTLAALNRNPLAFVNGLERISRDYPDYATGNHPADAVRRSVVSGVLPVHAHSIPIRHSEAFRRLQTELRREIAGKSR